MKFKIIVFVLFFISFGLRADDLQSIIQEKVDQQKISEQMPEKKSMKKYGLILFFSDECPYCQRFAPILKKYTDENHIIVRAVSFSGRGLPDFPNPIMPTDQTIQHYYGSSQIRYPSVWMYDPDEPFGGKIRISNGFISYDQLDNIWHTANQPQYTKVFE